MAIEKLNWKESDETNEDVSFENQELSIRLIYDKINEIIDKLNNRG